MGERATIRVTVVCSPAAREVFEHALSLPGGTTVRGAVQASGLAARYLALDWESLAPGVWGRAVDWERKLCDGDRVELCRPLLVDPKTARRARFARQGARGTGLFTKRRP